MKRDPSAEAWDGDVERPRDGPSEREVEFPHPLLRDEGRLGSKREDVGTGVAEVDVGSLRRLAGRWSGFFVRGGTSGGGEGRGSWTVGEAEDEVGRRVEGKLGARRHERDDVLELGVPDEEPRGGKRLRVAMRVATPLANASL